MSETETSSALRGEVKSGLKVQLPEAHLRLLQTAAAAANEAASIEEAARICLREICLLTGWPLGHLYLKSPHDPSQLVATNVWYPDDPALFGGWKQLTETMVMPIGVGLPGRVALSAQPDWIA